MELRSFYTDDSNDYKKYLPESLSLLPYDVYALEIPFLILKSKRGFLAELESWSLSIYNELNALSVDFNLTSTDFSRALSLSKFNAF